MQYVSELMFDFIESLEVESGRSKFTARNYELYLTRLIYFAGEELKPADIDQEWLRFVCNNAGLSFDCFAWFFEVFSEAQYQVA